MASFTVRRGDSAELALTITRLNPTTGVTGPVDITTALFTFTAKYRVSDADELAVIRKQSGSAGVEVTDGLAGRLLITIAPSDTDALSAPNAFVADVQMEEANGRITTVWFGTLLLAADVTRVGV